MVVVRVADGEAPLDGHGDDHVDGADQGDSVEGVVEPGEDPEQGPRVELLPSARGPGGAPSSVWLQHGKHHVQSVEGHQACYKKCKYMNIFILSSLETFKGQ